MSIYDDIMSGKYENKKSLSFYKEELPTSTEDISLDEQAEDYYLEEILIKQQFKEDALAYVNMIGHSRAEMVFNKAWCSQYLNCLDAVVDELIELAKIAGVLDLDEDED